MSDDLKEEIENRGKTIADYQAVLEEKNLQIEAQRRFITQLKTLSELDRKALNMMLGHVEEAYSQGREDERKDVVQYLRDYDFPDAGSGSSPEAALDAVTENIEAKKHVRESDD